jgi:hypothetical protein
LYGVSFNDTNNGTVVGELGTIFRTTNGGMTWTPQSSGTINDLQDVCFTDTNNGTAVGLNGTILRTTNGGTNWTIQSSGTTDFLFGVFYTDTYNGTVVGSNGTILHTTNGGVTFIEEESNPTQTNSFQLSQNYPNPFNPRTNIQYAVNSMQLVSLKVYDILGREVATLVNEEKPAGEYEVEFNAVNLPSGIYFYQIRAGNFSETKKMVLIR